MRGAAWILMLLMACSGGGGSDPFPDLERLALASGPTRFSVWIADDAGAQERGLMDATEEDLAPLADGSIPAMLFVLGPPRFVSFWMRDTEVALDLAYLDETGRIVEIHSLLALDESLVPSSVPVAFAFELAAGTLAAQGIGVGDRIELP